MSYYEFLESLDQETTTSTIEWEQIKDSSMEPVDGYSPYFDYNIQ